MYKNAYSIKPVIELLKPFVRRFMVVNHQSSINEIIHPKPTGYSYLNWIIDGVWQLKSGEFCSMKTPIFFAGQIKDEDIVITHTGSFKHIATEFTALGFYKLTGIKGIDCLNKPRSPQHFSKALDLQFNQLLNQSLHLSTAKGLEHYQRNLEASLLTMIDNQHTVPDYLIKGVKKIEEVDGLITIKEMCKDLDISQRHFNRQFTEIVGLSPKYFSRVLQMNKALQALLSNDRDYLSQIANETGYYDESHFIRVIQHFFNNSPSQFLNSRQETLFSFLGKSRTLPKE